MPARPPCNVNPVSPSSGPAHKPACCFLMCLIQARSGGLPRRSPRLEFLGRELAAGRASLGELLSGPKMRARAWAYSSSRWARDLAGATGAGALSAAFRGGRARMRGGGAESDSDGAPSGGRTRATMGAAAGALALLLHRNASATLACSTFPRDPWPTHASCQSRRSCCCHVPPGRASGALDVEPTAGPASAHVCESRAAVGAAAGRSGAAVAGPNALGPAGCIVAGSSSTSHSSGTLAAAA